MRLPGFGQGGSLPGATAICTLREAVTGVGAVERSLAFFDRQGYLAMSGQVVDVNTVAAPKQRNTKAEKQAIREGREPEDWQHQPAKLRPKEHDARWTVKTTKFRCGEGETPMLGLGIPEFGYRNHASSDRCHRLIRPWLGVWADTSNKSSRSEDLLSLAHAGPPRPAEEAGHTTDAATHGSTADTDTFTQNRGIWQAR